MARLEGKVAIITGGASGIGEATAHHFANHGALAVVIADIQDQKGKDVAASVGSHRCVYIHCDVSDEQQVKLLVDSTINAYGRLDIMLSNAGVSRTCAHFQTVLDLDLEALDRMFGVNVRGMAACVKHAARAMVEGKVKGSIICTASVTGSVGSKVATDYSMSKHAVLGLVRSASRQLGVHGIRVNGVSPGAVATPMVCNALGMRVEEAEKYYESSSSMEGVLKVKHVVDAILFLASTESEFVTGHNLAVDGGSQ